MMTREQLALDLLAAVERDLAAMDAECAPLRVDADAGRGSYNAYDEALNVHLEGLRDTCAAAVAQAEGERSQ